MDFGDHEIVRIDIPKIVLGILTNNSLLRNEDYKVIKVEVPDFDYSTSEEWKAAKKESDKAYKRLKEIEFKLRHK